MYDDLVPKTQTPLELRANRQVARKTILYAVSSRVSPLAIAGALKEDELNACPYRVRKALYDYAEREFRFQGVVIQWLAAELRNTSGSGSSSPDPSSTAKS